MNIARRLEALLEQDGLGLGQQSVPECVVCPCLGNDPTPLFLLNPLLFSHDAPLSSTGLKRLAWPCSRRSLESSPWRVSPVCACRSSIRKWNSIGRTAHDIITNGLWAQTCREKV